MGKEAEIRNLAASLQIRGIAAILLAMQEAEFPANLKSVKLRENQLIKNRWNFPQQTKWQDVGKI